MCERYIEKKMISCFFTHKVCVIGVECIYLQKAVVGKTEDSFCRAIRKRKSTERSKEKNWKRGT